MPRGDAEETNRAGQAAAAVDQHGAEQAHGVAAPAVAHRLDVGVGRRDGWTSVIAGPRRVVSGDAAGPWRPVAPPSWSGSARPAAERCAEGRRSSRRRCSSAWVPSVPAANTTCRVVKVRLARPAGAGR